MEYFLLFVAGLLSSIHCVGMCGCFVSAYSINIKKEVSPIKKILSHLLYSLGRLTTYTFLGCLMGFIGSSFYFLAKMAGLQNFITALSGFIMIYLGLSIIGIVKKFPLLKKHRGPFDKLSKYLFPKFMNKKGFLFTYPIGLILGFLPCCLLYTVELQAMTTGSPIKGALFMLSFGLGTVPALFSFGMIVNIINNQLKHRMMGYAGYIVILLGFASIYRALH